ncbi:MULTISPECIES: aspartate aminotransferase family protein [Rhodobacterales]|jgi:adenosylmethionine-8-amino-7-oxononanoate aminotransferase|uniref:aspartate aminotransferase family protein n=1 Tax=Rhodobacterales TaxID=204455 RepID=UPI00237FB584|nr:aspartate aminotransferase family protein [Phaeobacter gallaeciensis]MDE4140139.1 aspartate aminotransferase family protein [Phaeobacter gallaeciensis]MDE4148251.1 aspartate aminotransferase family protein [Phaeobacter gallaeciensis]MDE4152806.1 aspartate aminotransferase family protein [Phaeobacter gallaeciensis]MDE4227861.1 aspartate aminotransferase family protein [Phaeobacter gallaeciensis]MDE4257271.1 aspartate aminotransferase family protein [Phaeobacter gallaeciensis]
MSHVFPRHTKANLPTAVGGDGCYLIDSTGKRYFDGSGGAAVSCLGHSDAAVIAAVQQQVGKLAFAHTGFMTSEPAEALADLLIANAPGDLDRVYFVSGGSEATEAAIKLARQYFLEKGEPERRHLIARRQSYHGNTLGALAAGGNAWRRQQFDPLLIGVSHIAPCYEYVDRAEGESSFDYGQRAANELEAEILRLGPETVMAFMAEPVVGATSGAVPAVEGYFKRIREICDKYGVLLILDEVMCGMGRTGHLFACDADGVAPDILCIAKGLGAGYQPVGAMLCSRQIYESIEGGSGFFQHGHTYIGHPVATAAGLAVVSQMLERDLVARCAAMGDRLQSALQEQFGQHPNVGDIRGRGLFRGIELVRDRDSKTPFDPSLGLAAKIKKAAFEAGLICYPMSGTRDGRNGDHILLAPPFIISGDQIAEVVDKLDVAITQSLPQG